MAKAKPPTKSQRERWTRIVELGCAVVACLRPPGIHHCGTGAGGRKDHNKVIGLCHHHHQGEEGIHTLSRRVWEPIYGTEQYLMHKTEQLLERKE